MIVAVGPWLMPLLGGLARLPPLTVTQQQAFHFAPRDNKDATWPVSFYKDDMSMYGLPGGRDGQAPGAVKVGENGDGTTTTADDRDGVASAEARARVSAFAAERLPGLDSQPVNELTGTPSRPQAPPRGDRARRGTPPALAVLAPVPTGTAGARVLPEARVWQQADDLRAVK